uniref:Alkaline phosphatase family protein n=1 Tax=Spongospora subterranea TaxID=70186 RepID=A0A0H5RDB5_9EUKA|eukprot:CRZ11582.1 hypothetical protein [Spongospora subterranea]
MHDDALDVVITPRPQYMSDGRKRPDIWTKPANLRDELQGILGQFPMHRFWGPMSGIQSSKWIAEASKIVDNEFDPVFSFIYLPHLDYVLQKRGPADTEGSVIKELGLIDEVVKDLVGFYEARGAKVVILSEYGIGNVNEPVHINRVLNQAGYITTRTERDGLTLDCGSSRAFAIADHQIAMVHVARDADREPLKKLLQQVSGIEHVFGKADAPVWAAGSFHPERAGDLLCIAKRSAWFTYYFWLHDNDAPDYAGTVAIHDKPGYDPCELLLAYPSWTGEWFGYFNLFARAILSQICRLRVLISATPYHEQACLSIRGSHGRIDEAIAPIVIFPSLTSKEGIVDSCDIFNILLKTVSSENNLDSTAA